MQPSIALPARPASTPVDLRSLCRAIGALALAPASVPAGFDHAISYHPERAGGPPATGPADVVGSIDGIQRRWRLTTRDRRAVTLEYAAAGLLPADYDHRQLASDQRLWLACSYRDYDFVAQLPGGLHVEVFDAHSPRALAIATDAHTGQVRRQLEHTLARDHHPDDDRLLVLDGSIADLPGHPQLAGIIKDTTSTAWLADRTEIEQLPLGHRSTAFTILAEGRHRTDTASCYLRLHPPGQHDPWDHGLIRLETTHPRLLDPLAAWALRNRQRPHADDQRWERHLAPIRRVEDVLRARAPQLPTHS